MSLELDFESTQYMATYTNWTNVHILSLFVLIKEQIRIFCSSAPASSTFIISSRRVNRCHPYEVLRHNEEMDATTESWTDTLLSASG